MAYLIKDSAVQGSELDICLKDITHTGEDGYTDINTIGLKGIKARMLADFGPKEHDMATQSRNQYFNTRRKFKERPKWFFRRLELNELQMNKADPDFQVSTSFKANLIFYNSGLERREREKVFKEADGVWDYDLFKKIILAKYELKHELDCSMVDRAFKNRGYANAHQTYVIHEPARGIDGTDLYPYDCDEDNLDDRVDLSQRLFDPGRPTLKATGDGDESDDDEPYQEEDPCEVNWINEYGDCCDMHGVPTEDPWYDDDDAWSYFTDYSENAQKICDSELVEWVDQGNGEIIPWQWYQQDGDWDCYLACSVEDDNSLSTDGHEEACLVEMADIYLAVCKDLANGLDKELEESQIQTMRNTFIADARAKRNFGRSSGFVGKNRNSRRKGSRPKGRGKGKTKGRRRWGPRKGPKRSQ